MAIFRRVLVALAIVASATLIAPAGPAQAGGQAVTICFPAGEFQGDLIWDCHTIVIPEVAPKPPWPEECISCPTFIDILDKLKLEEQWAYQNQLGQGLHLLSKANLVKDPKEAEQLQRQATERFLAAAEVLGKSEIDLGAVGWADVKHDKVYEDQALTPVGVHLVEGLRLIQPTPGDPTPQPSLEKAMDHFQQAYKELVNLYAG